MGWIRFFQGSSPWLADGRSSSLRVLCVHICLVALCVPISSSSKDIRLD